MSDDPKKVAAAIAAIKSAGGTPEDINDYLKSIGAVDVTDADPNAALHAEFKRGDLKKRIDNENAQDVAPSAWRAIPEAFQTVAAGVPGAKQIMSRARAKIEGRPLADVQREVNAETSDVPYASAVGRALGTTALMPILPASGAASGAIIGGLDQALANDQSGPLERGLRTLAGVAGGAAAGKGTDMLLAAPRVLLSRSGAATKAALERTRDEISGPAYSTALANGRGRALDPEMKAALAEPDIKDIADRVLRLKQNEGMNVETPEVLDQIYKEMSDWSHGLEKASNVTDQGKANMIRGTKQHVRLLKDQFLDAADKQVPGYRGAVEGHAEASQPIQGFDLGYDAVRRGNAQLPAAKNLTNPQKSLDAALDAPLTPAEGRGMASGSLAAARDLLAKRHPFAAAWNVTAPLTAGDQAAGRQLPSAIQKALLALLSQRATP